MAARDDGLHTGPGRRCGCMLTIRGSVVGVVFSVFLGRTLGLWRPSGINDLRRHGFGSLLRLPLLINLVSGLALDRYAGPGPWFCARRA